MKKALKITAVVVLVFLIALISIPFLFKDKILNAITTEANKQLNAKLAIQDISLSVFKNFPDVTISIDEFSLIGINEFEGDTLLSAKTFSVTTDIMSAIKGSEIKVKKVLIDKANLNLLVDKNGKANWDITKPSEQKAKEGTAEEPSNFKIALKKLEIKESNVVYDDKQSGIFTRISKLNHELKGDLTADFTDLVTQTHIEALTYSMGPVNYLKNAAIDYIANFALDLKNSVYEFKENELLLNDLSLKANGKIEMPGNDIKMDISYEALKNEFKSFLSLIPNAYNESFKDLKSSGKLAFNGYVKGVYNENSIPGYGLNLLIENGSFQYPSLPKAVSNVQVKCKIDCPNGEPDATVIDIPVLKMNLGEFPIDGRLNVKTPVSDAAIDGAVNGSLNLSAIKDFYPLEAGTNLKGIIKADVTAKGRMSSIDKARYEEFNLSGIAQLSNFDYSAKDLAQPVSISNAELKFNPKSLELTDLKLKTGLSDIQAKGKLENHIAYVFRDEPIKGTIDLVSNLLNLNPFMTNESTTTVTTTTAPTEEVMGYIRIPANVDFSVNAAIAKLIYDNLNIENVKGQLRVGNQTVSMSNVAMNLLGGSLKMSGLYNTQKAEGPSVDLKLDVQNFDIKQTAKTFNTVKQLAPIAENTTGKVSSSFSMKANADKDFNLHYSSVNANGSFSSSQVVIEGFEMVKKTAEALKIDKLKKWQMEKLSGQFEIVNGKLFVKPFDTKIGNYKTRIGGSNGIDQSIDYVFNIEIPKSDFGGAANAVLNNLMAQANSKGIQGAIPDIIPVDVLVSGTFMNPKIKTNLKEKGKDALNNLKIQAEQRAKEEAEKLKQQAQAEIDKQKKELESKANAEKERLKAEAEKAKQEAERKAKEEAEKAKEKAKQEAGKKIKGIFGK